MKSLVTQHAVGDFKPFVLAEVPFPLAPTPFSNGFHGHCLPAPRDVRARGADPASLAAQRGGAPPGLGNILSLSRGSKTSRWPGRQRLLPMQVATFETNPLCIMQRMPPLLASATPHPSPETNHCRAPACTAPPPPSRAARSHGAAPAAARRLLKGGRRLLKAPWGGARRSAAAPFPAGARGAGLSLRGAQRGPDSPARRRERHFYSGDA